MYLGVSAALKRDAERPLGIAEHAPTEECVRRRDDCGVVRGVVAAKEELRRHVVHLIIRRLHAHGRGGEGALDEICLRLGVVEGSEAFVERLRSEAQLDVGLSIEGLLGGAGEGVRRGVKWGGGGNGGGGKRGGGAGGKGGGGEEGGKKGGKKRGKKGGKEGGKERGTPGR